MKIMFTCMLAVLAAVRAGAASPEDDLKAGIDAWNEGDLIGAIGFYETAADAGLAEAQFRLAYIRDYSNDDVDAVRLYQAAADQGYAEAYVGLANMYVKGEGVEVDERKAVKLYESAADLDHIPALVLLARYLNAGEIGLAVNVKRAGTLLIRAAELGDEGAARELIKAYQEGSYGLQADQEQAAYWQARLAERQTDNGA